MKIRCKNCYKVLKEKEEYCTSCGAHSEQIAKAMKTGNYGPDNLSTLKLCLLMFALFAFFGSGIFLIVFSIVKDDVTMTFVSKGNALVFTSFLTFISISLISKKAYKDFWWNDDLNHMLGAIIISILGIGIVTLLSMMNSITQVIPSFITNYLKSGTASWFEGFPNVSLIFVCYILVILVEEIIRRLLIDAFDEYTLLNDLWIFIFTTIIVSFLHFAWLMSLETVCLSLLINGLMVGLYMNTNRSIGFNVIIRIIILVIQCVIFFN